jgi:hypothetical protein
MGGTEILKSDGEFPAIKFSAELLPVSHPEYSAKVAENLGKYPLDVCKLTYHDWPYEQGQSK